MADKSVLSTYKSVAASSTDAHVVDAITGAKIAVVGAVINQGDTTASTVTFNSLPWTNEVQTITVDATGGTFTITYSGQTTSATAYNASASTVQTNLVALSNIDSGDVTVTGGPGDAGGTTPYVLTFGGALAQKDVAAVTTNAGSLTGGAGTATVATSTAGPVGTALTPAFKAGANGTIALAPGEGAWFRTNAGEGLSVTTGSGSTTGIQVQYVIERA